MGLVGSRRPFPFLDASRRRGALPMAPGNQNTAGPRAGDGRTRSFYMYVIIKVDNYI